MKMHLGAYRRLQNYDILDQGGFTKFQCYLCLCDSREGKSDTLPQVGPATADRVQCGEEKQMGAASRPWEGIVMFPPLHLEFGLVKYFVTYLVEKFALCRLQVPLRLLPQSVWGIK